MRRRLAITLIALLALATAVAPTAALGPVFAQPRTGEQGGVQPDEQSEQREAGSGGGGAGQQNEETQTDPQQGGGGTAEQGPPWTYQMSKITLGLVFLVLLAIGLLYYRLVIVRQREGI